MTKARVGKRVTINGVLCVIVSRNGPIIKVWCPSLCIFGSVMIGAAREVALDHEPCGLSFDQLIKQLKRM